LLLHINSVPADELLAATIREAQEMTGRPEQFLIAAGQSLSQLMQNDYDRLLSLLRKIRPAR
jgi:predicted ArsR family transcriptional regulator